MESGATLRLIPLPDPAGPWPLVLLVTFAGLALILLLHYTSARHLSLRRRRTLLAIRLFSGFLLALCWWGPYIERQIGSGEKPLVFVAVDASRSAGVMDGPGGVSRRTHFLEAFGKTSAAFDDLKTRADVRLFDFDTEIRPVEKFDDKTPGNQTAIGASLERLAAQAAGRRLLAIVLSGDGAQRALPPIDGDPRSAAHRLVDREIQLHAVPVGTSTLSNSAMDVIADDLVVPPTVFVKNRVVATARIRAVGVAGQELTARLLIESSAPSADGKARLMVLAAPPQKISVKENQVLIPVEFSFIAEDPGELKLTFEIEPLANEPLKTNNSLTTYLTVLKGGIRVAYFDTLRPEQKFLRRMDDSPDIQLDFQEILFGGQKRSSPLDDSWFATGKYDVFILGDIPRSTFTEAQLTRLARLVESGAGLMMLGGLHSFDGGGYASSPLAEILPVDMRPMPELQGTSFDPALHNTQPLQMLPHAQGVQHYAMRLDGPEQNVARWKELAPLNGANKFLGIKPLGVVLAESPDKIPLLVAQDVGRARSIAFAGDTTCQWAMHGKLELHQRFWQQVILWLAHKETQGDDAVWVQLDSRRFRPGQPVEFRYGARDADKRPIDDATFTINIADPAGKRIRVPDAGTGPERRARFLESLQPGEYTLEVNGNRGGKSLGLPSRARFFVYEQDLELHNPAADFVLLDELTRITGGEVYQPERLDDLWKRLKQDAMQASAAPPEPVRLWDNWALLLLFVAAMTTEWVLRKRYGLV